MTSTNTYHHRNSSISNWRWARCLQSSLAMQHITAVLFSLWCAIAFGEAALSIPPLPSAEYDDTEVVTNAALPAVGADARLFSFRLELDATPSNCVSLVFGRDADSDGVLSRAEESLLVGWNCGTWQVVDCATGETVVEPGASGWTALEWRLFAVPGLVPRSLEASVGGIPVFAALAANPPRFLFDPGWDTVKVVCRGLDAPNAQIDCSTENTPLTIRIR